MDDPPSDKPCGDPTGDRTQGHARNVAGPEVNAATSAQGGEAPQRDLPPADAPPADARSSDVPLVDVRLAEENIADFHARAPVPVRAHVKGHRTVELARMQMAAGACGIAVTRVAGTEAYLDAGIDDVVVAWPWRDAALLDRFVALARRCRLSLHVDDPATVRTLSDAARRHDVTAGVRALSAEVAFAAAELPGVRLDGVTGYYEPGPAPALASARDQALRVVALAEEVRGRGLACPVVAFGGTPVVDALVPGVTELGAGAYVLGDAGLAALGVMPLGRVAISVADAALLDGCGQPWHPEPGVRRGDRLVPAHVCPLVLRVPVLRTTKGERWRVLNGVDVFGQDVR